MQTFILVHRLIGYPTVFILAPAALLAFTNAAVHRGWGKAYFYCILFLYGTGTVFTFTEHPWGSWEFARNLAFNFFGFSMLLYAVRSIRLFRAQSPVTPDSTDRSLAWILTASVAALFAVAVIRNVPMRYFTAGGILLCIFEWRELRRGVWEKPVLFRRHQRYILASYCYVLTVVSIVHLKDELSGNARWLWPFFLFLPVIWLMSGSKAGLTLPGTSSRISHAALSRWTVRAVVCVTALFGGYIVWDLLNGPVLMGQG